MVGAGRAPGRRAGLCLLLPVRERLSAESEGSKQQPDVGRQCRVACFPGPAAGSFQGVLWETAPVCPVLSDESVFSLHQVTRQHDWIPHPPAQPRSKEVVRRWRKVQIPAAEEEWRAAAKLESLQPE